MCYVKPYLKRKPQKSIFPILACVLQPLLICSQSIHCLLCKVPCERGESSLQANPGALKVHSQAICPSSQTAVDSALGRQNSQSVGRIEGQTDSKSRYELWIPLPCSINAQIQASIDPCPLSSKPDPHDSKTWGGKEPSRKSAEAQKSIGKYLHLVDNSCPKTRLQCSTGQTYPSDRLTFRWGHKISLVYLVTLPPKEDCELRKERSRASSLRKLHPCLCVGTMFF